MWEILLWNLGLILVMWFKLVFVLEVMDVVVFSVFWLLVVVVLFSVFLIFCILINVDVDSWSVGNWICCIFLSILLLFRVV